MGYELHISRAAEYYDSDRHPIALDEWLAYAESRPTLNVGGWLGWDEDRQPIYEQTCTDGSVVLVDLVRGCHRDQGTLRRRRLPRVRKHRRGPAGQSSRRPRRAVHGERCSSPHSVDVRLRPTPWPPLRDPRGRAAGSPAGSRKAVRGASELRPRMDTAPCRRRSVSRAGRWRWVAVNRAARG